MNRSDAARVSRALPRLTCALLLGLACALPALPSFARQRADAATTPPSTTFPAWERLTPAQREQLIAPVRERWNANPGQRARMLGHAKRWQQLTPEQRNRAHRGRARLQDMTPAQRAEARATFERMRALPDAERKALREQLRTMTPEQRRAWMQTPGREQPPRN